MGIHTLSPVCSWGASSMTSELGSGTSACHGQPLFTVGCAHWSPLVDVSEVVVKHRYLLIKHPVPGQLWPRYPPGDAECPLQGCFGTCNTVTDLLFLALIKTVPRGCFSPFRTPCRASPLPWARRQAWVFCRSPQQGGDTPTEDRAWGTDYRPTQPFVPGMPSDTLKVYVLFRSIYILQ